MKTLMLISVFLATVSFSGKSSSEQISKSGTQSTLNAPQGWADGVNCDNYALGAYYGYLSGNPGDLEGAADTFDGAFIDCMGGGGHSSKTVTLESTEYEQPEQP